MLRKMMNRMMAGDYLRGFNISLEGGNYMRIKHLLFAGNILVFFYANVTFLMHLRHIQLLVPGSSGAAQDHLLKMSDHITPRGG